MSNYELKTVSVKSMIKNVPVIFGILGALIGIFTFFIFPTELAKNLAFGARLLSWLIFVILYSLIMVIGVMLVSMLYNWISGKLGGIIINIEQKEE